MKITKIMLLLILAIIPKMATAEHENFKFMKTATSSKTNLNTGNVGNVIPTATETIMKTKVNPKNIIGAIGERCTRSGKCIKTLEHASPHIFNYIDKISSTLSVAVAVNEAYSDYQETKSKARFFLTGTTSVLKNWAISSGTISAAAACGPFAPVCAIGGTFAVWNFTPSSKDFTNMIMHD